MSTKLIGHVDSDCFYVSAERVRNPHLRNVPCGVLGNQGACTIAKSYELKEYGVKTGTPVWEARKLCPHAIFVKRDFRWYEAVSKRMLELLKTVSPCVEYYSIDEMFFNADELLRIYKMPIEEAVFCLQEQIRREIGIPVSIGIAPSKTLAKLGSDSAKPYGCQTLLKPDDEFLRSQPVDELCGVGWRSATKLNKLGIKTCLDFIKADRLKIRDLLTIKGEALWYELKGEAVNPIITKRPTRKALARGGSIGRKSNDVDKLTGWMTRTVERLSEALNENRLHTQQLTMSVQYEDHYSWANAVKLDDPTSSFNDLLLAAKSLFARLPLAKKVGYMHLISEKLTPQGLVQLSLFGDHAEQKCKENKIDQLKAEVNSKLGRFAVRSGDTLKVNDLYEDTANDYDICDVSGKLCF